MVWVAAVLGVMMSVCKLLSVRCERQCVAVLLCSSCCGCVNALHWTVAVAFGSRSRAATVTMMCRSFRSGCGVVSRHVGLLVQCHRVAALGRCAGVVVVVCIDACDARGCGTSLRLGCQALSCCCSACASLAAVTGCLQSLFCCCCVLSACLHVHGVAVVAL